MTNATINDILEMLNSDMVSYGFLAQCVAQTDGNDIPLDVRVKNLLAELLASRKVEVGVTKLATADHVEFIAWKGTVDERVRRAMESVCNTIGHDKEFAYWLCLRDKVDRFEGGEL